MNFSGLTLVVDDEAHIRKFITLVLRSIGVTNVIEAPNGAAGVEAYQANQPDLVLLDVNMPQLDGIETLKRIKEINSDAVCVMLTSLANRHTVEQAAELGAANYIRKDTPKEEIAIALRDTIEACFESEDPAP